MGGSGGVDDGNGVQGTVGELVWVRRRNGSWWPGQIINVKELSKAVVRAAKPGTRTPVKLFGREDAIIDWFNLDRSKRVKQFRCGEFDECIEKAKAADSGNKKAVKYARKEDAIVCALKIENSSKYKEILISKKAAEKDNGSCSTASPVISGVGEGMHEECASPEGRKSLRIFHHVASSAEPSEINMPNIPSKRGKRRKTPIDSEDDGPVGSKRTRGMKDLVLDVSSEKKHEVDGVSNEVQPQNVDKRNFVTSKSPANSSKGNSPSMKKTRSVEAIENGHELKKRKDRRRTLSKVLEWSIMVSVPDTYHEVSPTVGSHLMCVSDRETVLDPVDPEGIMSGGANNGLDGEDAKCGDMTISDDFDSTCGASRVSKEIKENGNANVLVSHDSGSSEELYDVNLVMDDGTSGFSHAAQSGSQGNLHVGCAMQMESGCAMQMESGEQVKVVPVMVEIIPQSDSTSSAAALEGISLEIMESSYKWQSKKKRNLRHPTAHQRKELKNIEGVVNNGCSVQKLGLTQHLGGYGEGPDLKFDSIEIEILDSEVGLSNWGKHASRREIIEQPPDKTKLVDPTPTRSLPHRRSRSLVPSKYEEADFPIRISQQEADVEPTLFDVQVESKSISRPQHPIVSFMSKLLGKPIIGNPLTVEIMRSGYSDQLLKHYPDGKPPIKHPAPRTGSRKGLSKNGGASPKKTRRLSALSGVRKCKKVNKHPVVEKPRSSAIACIPLNVVFSRLNEAVNGSKQHHFHTPS